MRSGMTEPFLLFDDARSDGAGPARLYQKPIGLVAADRLEDIRPALDELRRQLASGRHVAGFLAYEAGFALDFTHTGLHEPHRFPPGKPPFMATPHYDQLGHVEGWMTLRGDRIRIDGIGVRDRTWGPRGGPYAASPKVYASDIERVKHPGGARWREIERERGRGRIQYIFGHRKDGTGFLGFARVQDGDAEHEVDRFVGKGQLVGRRYTERNLVNDAVKPGAPSCEID